MQDDGAAITGMATRVQISAQLARRLLNAGYRKVVPDTPAEEDVKALAQDLAHTSNVGSDFEDDARRLLTKGWHKLPPEPDTPPEPQERYYVGDGQSDNKVYERGRELYAETYLAMDADRIARLLNLDAKYEDGIEAEVEQLRLRADAFQAKFEEQCQQGDDMFISHYKAIKRAVTAEAELERLQDKASARAVKATELALEDARAELIRELEDRDLERDLFAARVKELEAALDDAHQDDGPTEPLFTGKLIGHSEYAGGGCEVVLDLPDWPGDDALRVKREVDVWPAGVRPAAPAQAVTAEMVEQAVFNSVLNDDPPSEWNGDEWGEVTSRINDQLGRTVAWAHPEAGR